MNNGVDVRPHLVYQEVHRHFARCLALAFYLLSVDVDDHHVFRLDETLVADRRRAHDMTIGKARADVTVCRGNITLLVNESTKADDLGTKFVFGHRRDSTTNGSRENRTKKYGI